VTRVVHVVVAGEIGGAERMLVELASRPAQTAAEHAVALLTPNDGLRRVLQAAGLRVHDRGPVREGPLAFAWRTFGPRDVAWLAQILHDERADVAHLHTFASQVVGTRAAIRAGARVLRTEHSTRAYADPTCWPFSRWSLARADLCVAVSEHVRGVALGRAPWATPKMRVVHNGVDVDRFAPDGAHRPDELTFALSGRLEPRKGADLAVEAIGRVPDARLLVVGDGAERSALEATARARGVADRVRFHGHLADVRPVVRTAHAALCASRAEGLGVALLEAMSMGLPVVGFAVGGVPEIVEDGVTGMLCRGSDADALAAVMQRAVRARAELEAMGDAARRAVHARFSAAAMCEGYASAYASLAPLRTARNGGHAIAGR
jgi:glycosyltransferase involved in cell wall biosynthesis